MTSVIAVSERLDDQAVENWAGQEFGAAELGDARRTARLVELATVLGRKPSASFPAAVDDPAQLKATYRFFDNPAILPEAILASHIQATYGRLQALPRVLAIQDTTLLDWTEHPKTQGLGPLASARQQGLFVHSTLAFSPQRVPLGLLAQQVWARDPDEFAALPDHKTRAITDKESHKWLTSLAALVPARAACPTSQLISIGDREADIYDLFSAPRPTGVELLVRATQDRCVAESEHRLHAAVAAQPVSAELTVQVPRRPNQPARPAQLSVRWRLVNLKPPQRRQAEHLASVRLWVVWAVELAPPKGVPALDWLLLTTVPIQTAPQAVERLGWYSVRWGIEVWHKVLKSGCRVEQRQLETAERLQRSLSLFSVIAWRILYAVMLSRSLPELACSALLEPDEWQALYCAIHKVALAPATPPHLHQAVRWIASLGGFQGRKHDGEPGATVLWKGFQRLADLTYMYQVMRPPSRLRNVGKD
jgi:transposase-like protein/transposase Tn5 family protein